MSECWDYKSLTCPVRMGLKDRSQRLFSIFYLGKSLGGAIARKNRNYILPEIWTKPKGIGKKCLSFGFLPLLVLRHIHNPFWACRRIPYKILLKQSQSTHGAGTILFGQALAYWPEAVRMTYVHFWIRELKFYQKKYSWKVPTWNGHIWDL